MSTTTAAVSQQIRVQQCSFGRGFHSSLPADIRPSGRPVGTARDPPLSKLSGRRQGWLCGKGAARKAAGPAHLTLLGWWQQPACPIPFLHALLESRWAPSGVEHQRRCSELKPSGIFLHQSFFGSVFGFGLLVVCAGFSLGTCLGLCLFLKLLWVFCLVFFWSKHQNESHQHVCSPLFGFVLSDDSTALTDHITLTTDESGWDFGYLNTYF